jgi:rubrerythrin
VQKDPAEKENPQTAGRDGPSDEVSTAKVYVCDICGFSMLDTHCKLQCRRCGYIRDCSDP